MAFYLVLSLAATAGLFFLAGADFVGAMQLLIYVGGTLVLLVFGVMLTSQDRFISMKTSRVELWIARRRRRVPVRRAGVGGVERAGVARPRSGEQRRRCRSNRRRRRSAWGCLGVRVDAVAGSRPGYLLLFEIISVHLLVVLIGAAYLARARRKTEPRSSNDAPCHACQFA